MKSEGPFCFSILDATPWEPFGLTHPLQRPAYECVRVSSSCRIKRGTMALEQWKKRGGKEISSESSLIARCSCQIPILVFHLQFGLHVR